MAKRRTRGAPRELTRAELKALERRSMAIAPPVDAEPEADVAPVPAPARRGVLPPRGSRLAVAGPTLSRAQEMAYIRADLRRLVILGALMVVILIALAVVLR
ncbi:MAG: hypothetical protein IT340_23195 [Chloroflexi bacterium]|nr:hypothetical protein [Chloroflexota bacterium]